MLKDVEASGLLVREVKQTPEGELQVRYANGAYQVEADAIRRLLTLTELYVPTAATSVSLTGESLGMPTHTVKYRRPNRESSGLLQQSGRLELLPPQLIDGPDHQRDFHYPNFGLDVGLDLRTYLFDPDFPLLYQLSASLRGSVNLGGGWSLTGRWNQSIKSQFDRIVRDGGSALPPVRTDQKEYLQQGKSGIDNFALVKRGKLRDDIYYQAYGGILEEMYSGVGG
ncbi:MAG: YjbH domain-containing protein, partial [Planctomycetota bacterium]